LKRILVVDGGSLHAQDVARQVRKLGVFSEIVPGSAAVQVLQGPEPDGIIVTGMVSPRLDELLSKLSVPMLQLGEEFPPDSRLDSFLSEACGSERDWSMDRFLTEAVDKIRAQVGSARAICGLSGGVDSAVAAVLAHRAVGEQLTCIFVDHGFMRAGESEQIVATFREGFGIPLVHVQAQDRFLSKLEGIEDPEQKRRIIGIEFIRVFEEEAAKLGDAAFLVQGTVYPDVLESGVGPGTLVKSHHNVGGLPEDLRFELVEPLAVLFKDEVRQLGEKLQLPKEILWRHPFPGPGLAIRVLGAVTREKLDILRKADAIVMEELRRAGWYDKIWQAAVVLTNVRSVGVQRGGRTYDYVVGLRFVESRDGMSADWVRVPHDLLAGISARVLGEVQGVGRVVYDISPKPPATIEWE
jgi:GMP synthase (glutamine-hydrolysing)